MNTHALQHTAYSVLNDVRVTAPERRSILYRQGGGPMSDRGSDLMGKLLFRDAPINRSRARRHQRNQQNYPQGDTTAMRESWSAAD